MKSDLLKKLTSKYVLIKILVLFFISYIYLYRSYNNTERPYVTGDGFEYILMTEAYCNHFSPDIRLSDVLSFKEKFSKVHSWNDFYKKGVIDDLIIFMQNSKKEFMETNKWLFFNRNGKCHSYHFSFYSLVNLPVYVFAKHYGPLTPFYITNAILVIITCLIILFLAPFSFNQQVLLALCFCFSSCFWYLKWQHAEVLAACLVTTGMLLYFRKNYYWSIFILALANTQSDGLACGKRVRMPTSNLLAR